MHRRSAEDERGSFTEVETSTIFFSCLRYFQRECTWNAWT